MDSRTPIKEIARKAGVSEVTARARLRKLEQDVGLRYVLELEPMRAGLHFRYFIAAKLKRRPEKEELAHLLGCSIVPQFAALCEGQFDLFIYVAALSHIDAMRWQYSFRSALEEELVSWRMSHILLERQGLFPLKNELLNALPLQHPQPKLLAVLNENSRAPLTEIARKTGIELSTVQYHFNRMVRSGLIKRFTAVMEKPPKSCLIANFLTYTYGKRHQAMSEAARRLMRNEEPFQPLNTHLVVAESSGAYDGFFLGSFRDADEGYRHVREIERTFEGTLAMDSAIMADVVLGLPPFRSMDVELSYDDTDWTQSPRRRTA